MGRDISDPTPLNFATGHINASARNTIREGDLLAGLAANPAPEQWRHHVFAFLDETDIETLSDIVRSGAITYGTLAEAAGRTLPPHHPTRTWLEERA